MGLRSSINIRYLEFINGTKLESLKKIAYEDTRGTPIVAYGSILEAIETELSNYMPTQILHEQIKKYTTKDNIYLVEVSDAYKFRPDILSYIFYGSVEYFQILLILNQMKSLLEFNPSNTNNLMFVFKSDIMEKILDF